MLLRIKSAEADIRLETAVGGKEYQAWGRYEEQMLKTPPVGSFLRSQYRLEVNFLLNNQPDAKSDVNRMTLVCHIDPQDKEKSVIEKYTSIEGAKQYSSIKIARLEERLKNAHQENVFAQISEVRNLGGLAASVRQIARFYEFTETPVQENLTGEETIPALKIAGRMKAVYLKDLLQRFGGQDKKGNYPADFPSDIEIWIGRHNDFPYQIRYLNRKTPDSSVKTQILLESFYHVILNGEPIPGLKFEQLKVSDDVFSVKDETEEFLKSLNL